MARPHVPQFGNWGQDNVPYTMAFDIARKGKGRVGGKIINPNDPQENPELFAHMPTAPSPQAANAPPPSTNRAQTPEAIGRGGQRAGREEYGNPRQFAPSPSPSRHENFGSRKTGAGESVYQQHSRLGSQSGRPRQSAGSEYSFERSPMNPGYQAMNPGYQAKSGGRGSTSPAWDGRNSLHDSSHGASALKPRLKQSIREVESPERSATVPPFGGWDVRNPQDGEYTEIFGQLKEERHQTPLHRDGTERPPYRPTPRQNPDGGNTGCCFPFSKLFS